METQASVGASRKKLNTYGKTPNKRPQSSYDFDPYEFDGGDRTESLVIRPTPADARISASRPTNNRPTTKPALQRRDSKPNKPAPASAPIRPIQTDASIWDFDGDGDSRVVKKRKTPPGKNLESDKKGADQVPKPPQRAPQSTTRPTPQSRTASTATIKKNTQPPKQELKREPSSNTAPPPANRNATAVTATATATASVTAQPKTVVRPGSQITDYYMKRPQKLSQIPSSPSPPSSPQTFPRKLAGKATQPPTQPPRRMRLIDQLAEQATESSDAEPDAEPESQSSVSQRTASQFSILDDEPATPRRGGDQTPRALSQTATQSVKRRKLRATYGQQRSMLGEIGGAGDGSGDLDFADLGPSQRGLTPPLKMPNFDPFGMDDMDPEEDSQSKGGILGLHALRQAGANHRFADEISDLIERIGTPQQETQLVLTRRLALLELGRKLQDKKFVTRFSSYGAKENLFRGIGAEEDVISGFVLLAALLVLLVNASVPHLLEQLHADGVERLLLRQLKFEDDIANIARESSRNLSNKERSSVSTLRSALTQLEVWDKSPPSEMTPRVVCLKFLVLSCKNVSTISRQIVRRLERRLFGVVARAQDVSDKDDEDMMKNLAMSLSLLQEHSVSAIESDLRARWNSEYLPLAAPVLSKALTLPPEKFEQVGTPVLQLALNVTNNNATAATVFGTGQLVRQLADTTLALFTELQTSVERGTFSEGVHQRLVLFLGVLINISEHCPPTGEAISPGPGGEKSPLDKLMMIYLENHDRSGSADSVEQTSLGVTYGYLAILLGYSCTDTAFRQRLSVQSQGKGVKYLLQSIREFLALHEKAKMDDMNNSLQGLINSLQVMTRTAG